MHLLGTFTGCFLSLEQLPSSSSRSQLSHSSSEALPQPCLNFLCTSHCVDWHCLFGLPTDGAVERISLPMQETQETWVQSLGWEDPLEEGLATHSNILAWKVPWTEEPGGLQSMGSQRAGHDWVTEHTHVLLSVLPPPLALLEYKLQAGRDLLCLIPLGIISVWNSVWKTFNSHKYLLHE